MPPNTSRPRSWSSSARTSAQFMHNLEHQFAIVRRIHRSAWMLAIASGVLQVLVFPNPNLYWLCWIALAPLFTALLRAQHSDSIHLPDELQAPLQPASPLQGFALGYVAGVIWWAGTCYWVYDTMHLYGG